MPLQDFQDSILYLQKNNTLFALELSYRRPFLRFLRVDFRSTYLRHYYFHFYLAKEIKGDSVAKKAL